MTIVMARYLSVAGITMLLRCNAAVAAQRTFVATTGSDAHPCSLAQPCRGFGAALSHTDPGGEIVVLDSGGYGRVTINKSVTITAPAGVHAGISVFAGTNGIDIPAGGVIVVLRGLAISGQGGTDGIYVSGDNELTIERCDIGGMTNSGQRCFRRCCESCHRAQRFQWRHCIERCQRQHLSERRRKRARAGSHWSFVPQQYVFLLARLYLTFT